MNSRKGMETVERIRAQLDTIGTRLEKAQRTWRQYLKTAKAEWRLFGKDHPITLNRNVWASEAACSRSLRRLEQARDLLERRVAALRHYDINMSSILPVQIQLHVRMRTPHVIGTESRTWQFICALVDAEHAADLKHSHVASAERRLTEILTTLVQIRHDIDVIAESESFEEFCILRDSMEGAVSNFWERCRDLGMEDIGVGRRFEKTELLAHEHLIAFTRSPFALVELALLQLMARMARRGFQIARQTLITEYFSSARW